MAVKFARSKRTLSFINFDTLDIDIPPGNELKSTVNVYRYSSDNGSFHELQTISTLPDAYSGENFCGDIHFSLDEKSRYVSHRRHDSIVCFKVDPDNKQLTDQSHISSNGQEPRIFALDPNGLFMVAAHQKSRNAVVYQIDSLTGNLSATGYEAQLDMPVHVIFMNAS